MEAVRSSWTDERLDLLNERVEERFDNVDRRLDHVEARLAKLETLHEGMSLRLDSIQKSIVFLAITLSGGMIAGFSAIVALVATQI